MTGMIEGVLGFEIFDLGIFGGRKILASIFWDFLGYSKLMFLFFVLCHLMLPGNFYG